MKLLAQMRHAFRCQLYTLYYFYEAILRYKVRFAKPHQAEVTYPSAISKNVASILYPTVIMFIMLVRCALILSIPAVTSTPGRRIALGTEMYKGDRHFIESTIFLWSNIAFLTLRFSLNSSLSDYRFLALFRITECEPHWGAANFGLTPKDYFHFKRFRSMAFTFFHATVLSIVPFSSHFNAFLIFRAGLFGTHPFSSLLWSAFFIGWVFTLCAVIHSNFLVFLVVAKYISIKQSSIEQCLTGAYRQLALLKKTKKIAKKVALLSQIGKRWLYWQRYLHQNARYAHLQEELREYNKFCGSYLSFHFGNCILLIGYIIYIVLYSGTAAYYKFVYGWIGSIHGFLLFAIVFYANALVQKNRQMACYFTSLLTKFKSSRLSVYRQIKMHNLTSYLFLTPSGFTLLNGHLVWNDTFRIIVTYIAVYFTLIMKK